MTDPLRVVACSAHPAGYSLLSGWARDRGHRIVLLLTLPDMEHYGGGASVADRASGLDVLVTARLRTVAAPLVAALEPDLVVSAGYPRLIPPEITGVPRYGAVNLHPSPLPRGRGPCPQRLTYQGDQTLGATLHRTGREFDDGAVLSQRERPLRADDLTPRALMAAWNELLAVVLDEGVARAVAGEPGTPQDATAATYAGVFTDAERVLDWSEPATVLQRRVAALNVMRTSARGVVDGAEVTVRELRALATEAPAGTPGKVLDRTDGTLRVLTGAGVAELDLEP